MTKQFEEKVIREHIVDTKNYRYTVKDNTIQRLPLEYLDTTAALTEWETVKVLDGWTSLHGVDALIEDGKVVRGVRDGKTIYPYTRNKVSGWDNASRRLTVKQFEALWNDDDVMWS